MVIKHRRWWIAVAWLPLLLLPTISLSCGAAALTTSYIDGGFDGVTADPTSSPSQVVWRKAPQFDAAQLATIGYALPEYATTAFADVNAAASDTTSTWTSTLPTQVNANRSERALWVRFPSLDLTQRPPYVINLTYQVGLLLLP